MLYNLQLLRFVAAFLVVAHHSLTAVQTRLPALDISYLFNFGAVGVHVFFVISGFIMVYTQQRNFGASSPVQFLFRRIDRIYPIYWFCALLTIIAYYLIEGDFQQLGVWDWLGSLALLPGYSSKIIFVGWTLAYEIFFYLVFALVLALNLSMVRSLILLTLSFMLLVGVGIGVSGIKESEFLSVLTSVLLLEFVLGAWVAYLFLKLGASVLIGWVAAAFGMLLIAIGYFLGYDEVPRVLSWGLPSAFIILGAALTEKKKKSGKFMQLSKLVGDASYVLYLIHPMTIAVLVFCIPSGDIKPIFFFVFLTISLLGSTIFAILIDRFIQPRLRFYQSTS